MLSTSNVASEKTHTYPVSNNFKKCTEDVVIIAITRFIEGFRGEYEIVFTTTYYLF